MVLQCIKFSLLASLRVAFLNETIQALCLPTCHGPQQSGAHTSIERNEFETVVINPSNVLIDQ